VGDDAVDSVGCKALEEVLHALESNYLLQSHAVVGGLHNNDARIECLLLACLTDLLGYRFQVQIVVSRPWDVEDPELTLEGVSEGWPLGPRDVGC
jgi:hypothetical protein